MAKGLADLIESFVMMGQARAEVIRETYLARLRPVMHEPEIVKFRSR